MERNQVEHYKHGHRSEHMGVSRLLPHPPKKNKKITKIVTRKMSKNSPKVASYGRFDLKFGIGLKKDAEIIRNYFRSSHGDPFRDQERFSESVSRKRFPGNVLQKTFSRKRFPGNVFRKRFPENVFRKTSPGKRFPENVFRETCSEKRLPESIFR